MDSTPPQTESTQRIPEPIHPAIAFHEIEIPSLPAISAGYLARILNGTAAALVLFMLASLLPAGGGVVALLAIGVLLVTLISSLSVSNTGATRSISAAINSPSSGAALPPEIARILCESLPMRSYPGGFNLAARNLAESGYRGLVIRCYLKDSPPIRPFTVEFEPCPLSEVDVAFRGLALDTDELDDADERVSDTWRRVQRLWRTGAFWLIVPFGVFSTQAFRDAWRSQSVTAASLIWLILFAFALSLFLGGTHSSRFWIAPGCLIRRMSLWATGRLGVDMFFPEQCVLITYPTRGKTVGWTIASRTDELEDTGTELEARTLLRAWLSPLAPPSLAHVRGLFAGGR